MRNFSSIIYKVTFLFVALILVICLLPKTFSKYETNIHATADVDAAFYVITTNYQYQTIQLTNIIPRNESYAITFSVANTDGQNRLETRLRYNLSIRATTNLPLTFELYEGIVNENLTGIITNNVVEADEYGTYFRTINTNTKYFSYLYDEITYYTLLIYFPETYKNYMYQDIIEAIEIIIDSEQILVSDGA